MPFLAEDHFPVPNKDILSWYFDEPRYDIDNKIYIDARDESRYWTARQAKKAIRQIAAGFTKGYGLSSGDCVSIHGFNSIDYPVLVNGIVGFGGIYTGTNPAYQTFELVHHLKTSKAKVIIVEPELLKNLLAAIEELHISKENTLLFNHKDEPLIEGYKSWRTLFEHGEIDWPRIYDEKKLKNTTAARLYSSGTTGLAKAAQLSHYNLVAQGTFTAEWKPNPWQKRRLIALPMFHAATAPVSHFNPLRSGDTTFVLKRFELEPFLEGIDRLKIIDGQFVPPVVVAILMSPLKEKYSLKSLRFGLVGAAPLGKGPQARFKALMAEDAPMNQGWGMTETSCVCTLNFYADGHDATGSVGRMLPEMDSKLVDDDGNDITDFDVRGELCVRGPLIVQGYFENPEANARDWDKDGYFHTGDIAYRSKENKLWYTVDRKKELIKVRGNQVAPPELEAVLLSHPQIIDAAVIGVQPSEDAGTELPRAYIVRRPETGADLNVDSVKKWITDRLASYKRLEGGVKFVNEIPKNASGKILKKNLREQAKKEMAKEQGAKL